MLATAVLVLLVAASALVAAIGVQARGARWLAAVFLSIGVLRYGYVMVSLARASMADVLLMIVTTARSCWVRCVLHSGFAVAHPRSNFTVERTRSTRRSP